MHVPNGEAGSSEDTQYRVSRQQTSQDTECKYDTAYPTDAQSACHDGLYRLANLYNAPYLDAIFPQEHHSW
jgi:hypothetical protein